MEKINMAKLYKINPNGHADLLAENVSKAESFFARAKGLLGHSTLASSEVLWISPCNNIHTFFMKFTIDCVFVDKSLSVKKVVPKVKPFKIIGPFWKAYSVFEMSEGCVDKFQIKEGDQLYVVS